jgi:hypothetical protein
VKKYFLPKSSEIWFLGALILVTLGLRIYHLPYYPYHEDEVGSISVLRSIVETGFPYAENGTLYWSSLLGHYLMAIPLFFAESSPYSTRLVSVVFSALLLPVVYLMGKRIGGRWAGSIAALFLAFSAFENLYASMSRHYLPFQFFFVTGVFFAGEFFVRRRVGSGKWLFFAVLGAIGTHRFAVELFPVFALAALIGWRPDFFRTISFWVCSAIVAVAVYFNFLFIPDSGFINHVAIPLKMFALEDKGAFYEWFRRMTPFGVTLIILGIYPLVVEKNKLFWFYTSTFIFCMVFLSVVAPGDNPRYMANIYPLGIVLGSKSLTWWSGFAVRWSRQRDLLFRSEQPLLLVTCLVAALTFLTVFENRAVASGFGTYFRFVDQQPAHDFIKPRLRPSDLIISTEPGFAVLYLGRRPDYYLREKFDPATGSYGPFSAEEKTTTPYEFIDSPGQLIAVLEGTDQRIWFYTNWKITQTVSVAMDEEIKRFFKPVFSQNETYMLYRP